MTYFLQRTFTALIVFLLVACASKTIMNSNLSQDTIKKPISADNSSSAFKEKIIYQIELIIFLNLETKLQTRVELYQDCS